MTQKTLGLILEIAQRMVECGAEIGRVEESLTRICASYGCCRTDAYATTSNLIVTVETSDGEEFTQTRRVKGASPDMECLHCLNDLVRSLSKRPYSDAEIVAELDKIREIKPYSAPLQVFFYAVIAGSFCIFFGGRDVLEIVVALLVGGLVGMLNMFLSSLHANRILKSCVCSFAACLIAVSCARLCWIPTADNVIIGNIMSLIPGIGLANALRDLFTGDTITGLLRLMEAVLLALAIALGFWLAVYPFGGAV